MAWNDIPGNRIVTLDNINAAISEGIFTQKSTLSFAGSRCATRETAMAFVNIEPISGTNNKLAKKSELIAILKTPNRINIAAVGKNGSSFTNDGMNMTSTADYAPKSEVRMKVSMLKNGAFWFEDTLVMPAGVTTYTRNVRMPFILQPPANNDSITARYDSFTTNDTFYDYTITMNENMFVTRVKHFTSNWYPDNKSDCDYGSTTGGTFIYTTGGLTVTVGSKVYQSQSNNDLVTSKSFRVNGDNKRRVRTDSTGTVYYSGFDCG